MNSSYLDDTKVIPVSALDTASPAHLFRPSGDSLSWTAMPESVEAISTVPPAKPAPGFWEGLAWTVAFIVAAQIIPAIALFSWSIISTGGLDLVQDNVLYFLLGGDVLGVALTVLALRVRVGADWMKAIDLRRPAIVPLLLAVLCLPAIGMVSGCAALWVESISGIAEPSREMIGESLGKYAMWFCILAIAVGAAVNEELFCRGFLGRGFVGRYGVFFGVLLTSLVFGAIHMNPAQGVFAFGLGIGLHLTYLATRSLWVPMLLHFLNNALVVLTFSPSEDKQQLIGWDLLWYLIPAIVVAILSGYGLYRLRVRQVTDDRAA